MKSIICKVLFVLGFILILGLVGGIENGEPLVNALWCIPIMFVMLLVAKDSKIFEEDDEE